MSKSDNLNDELDGYLTLARAGLAPNDAQVQRVRQSLGNLEDLSASEGSQRALPPVPASASRWAFRRFFTRLMARPWLAPVLWLSLGFGGGFQWANRRLPSPPPLPSALSSTSKLSATTIGRSAFSRSVSLAPQLQPEEVSKTPLSTSRKANARVRPRPIARKARRAPQQATTPRVSTGTLQSELLLLQRIERAIRQDNGQLALALLQNLDPSRAMLREERLAMTVLANCQTSNETALNAADQFLQMYPLSVYQKRITKICTPV